VIRIYTDGSCNPAFAIGGWAAILLIGDEKLILSGNEKGTTHQRMELTAAICALNYIIKNNLQSEIIELYADSQYVVDIARRKEKLEASNFATRKQLAIRNEDLVKQLISDSSRLSVQFIKVKAHLKKKIRENEFNTEVDKLSRKIVRTTISRLI